MKRKDFELLIFKSLVNQVIYMNLVYKGAEFLVSQDWYKRLISADLLDDCDFSICVFHSKFNPRKPIQDEKKKKEFRTEIETFIPSQKRLSNCSRRLHAYLI